jgi:hypothetical protein
MISGLLIATAGTASAGSISYDFRADYSSMSYNADNLPTNSRFLLRTGRLDFKGALNESLTYQARWAFNKPATYGATATTATNQNRDSLNNSVELAFITHKVSDLFTLSLGKFNTEIGGFEGATSGADLYLTSPMYTHTGPGNTVGASATGTLAGGNFATNSSTNNLLYGAGLKATVTAMEGQTLSLVATNNSADATEGTNPSQNRGLLGAIYKGVFMDKALTGLLSYHELSTQAPNTLGKHTFMSAGVKVDMLPWAATLEFQTTDFKADAVGVTGKDNLNVVIGKLAFTSGMWTPRLEAFTGEEKREIGTTETNRFTGLGAVLEYKPTDDNFRYHVAFNTIASKPENTANEVTRNEIVVGARLFGDFLK